MAGVELREPGAGSHPRDRGVQRQGVLRGILHPRRGRRLQARRGGRRRAAQHLRLDRWIYSAMQKYFMTIKIFGQTSTRSRLLRGC